MSTSARFTGAANKDNTARREIYDYQSPAYASSIALTIKDRSKTIVQVAQLTGALSLTANVGSSTTPPYVGDKIEFLFTSDGTNRVVTFSTGFLPTGTLTVTASKSASAVFMFNGTAWIELSRAVSA